MSGLYFRWMWFWCWLCYRAYLALPIARNHQTRYGRFTLWLLGYGGSYAHSDLSSFHLCSYFHNSKEEQDAAWECFISVGRPSAPDVDK